MFVTAGIFHPPLAGRWAVQRALRRALRALDGYTFAETGSLDKAQPHLANCDALVLYFHHQRLSPLALAAFQNFVYQGGGVLAIHSATASFKQDPAYHAVLGGRFSGHGVVETFTLSPAAENPGPFGGLAGFAVHDELYLHTLEPGVQVHFTAQHQGESVPVVWTYTYGAGRVCYAAPGHRAATMQQPEYQRLLQRGLEWVCRA